MSGQKGRTIGEFHSQEAPDEPFMWSGDRVVPVFTMVHRSNHLNRMHIVIQNPGPDAEYIQIVTQLPGPGQGPLLIGRELDYMPIAGITKEIAEILRTLPTDPREALKTVA